MKHFIKIYVKVFETLTLFIINNYDIKCTP